MAPSKTPKQARMMAAAAHDPKFAKKVGVPRKVAAEFNRADAGTGIIKPRGKPAAKSLPRAKAGGTGRGLLGK